MNKKLIVYFSIFCYIVTKLHIVFIWCNLKKKYNLPGIEVGRRKECNLSSQECVTVLIWIDTNVYRDVTLAVRILQL